MGKLQLLVEGPTDSRIALAALEAAKLDISAIDVRIVGGINEARKLVESGNWWFGRRRWDIPTVVLADLDDKTLKTLADANAEWKPPVSFPPLSVCFAIPASEAWLFADDRSVAALAATEQGKAIAARLPLPEQIPDPKRLVKDVFGSMDRAVECLARSDISYAAARSPSLRYFLSEAARLLDVSLDLNIIEARSTTLNRDILSNLLYEIAPSKMIVYREAGGHTYTAEEMIREIREGSPLGKQYASDLLRVLRDWLARDARRA